MEPVALPHTSELPRLTDLTCGPRMGDTGQVPPASGHTVPTAGPDAARVRPREAWQLPAAPAPSPRPIPVCFPKAQERGVQILNLVGKLPPQHTHPHQRPPPHTPPHPPNANAGGRFRPARSETPRRGAKPSPKRDRLAQVRGGRQRQTHAPRVTFRKSAGSHRHPSP